MHGAGIDGMYDRDKLEWTRRCAERVHHLSQQADALCLALVTLYEDLHGGGLREAPSPEAPSSAQLIVSVPPSGRGAISGMSLPAPARLPSIAQKGSLARVGSLARMGSATRLPAVGGALAPVSAAARRGRLGMAAESQEDRRPEEADESEVIVAEALPPGWPSSLAKREGLEAPMRGGEMCNSNTVSAAVIAGKSNKRLRSGRSHQTSAVAGEDDEASWAGCGRRMRAAVVDPESKFNQARIMMATLVLIYDAVIMAYVSGFDVDVEGWLGHQLFLFAAFWLADMFFNFLLGFEDEDKELVVDLRRCAANYMKQTFVLDATLIALDLVTASIVHLPRSQSSSMTTIVSRLRLFRLLGLVRAIRTWRIVVDLIFGLDVESSSSSLAFVVFCLLGFTLLLSHFAACAWFHIGEHGPTDTGAHWINMDVEIGGENVPFLELARVVRYTSVLHWHVDLFTIGNPEMVTQNTYEKLFQIFNSLVALLLACTVVSIMSSMLVDTHMHRRSRTAKLRALHQYLLENHVRAETASLVLKQAKKRIETSSRMTDKDVMALSLLSSHVRSTLQFEICLPCLKSHPLLRLWSRLDHLSAEDFCMVGTHFSMVLPHEVLFYGGVRSRHVVYIMSGNGDYVKQPETSWVEEPTREKFTPSSWLCEAALAVHWIHVGTCEASTPCQIFSVDAEHWVEHLPQHGSFKTVACGYASELCKRVHAACPPSASWPDDLHVPFTDYTQLVAAMGPQIQQTIGIDALQEATEFRKIPERKIERLEQQVRSGQSVVFVDKTGHLKRVTSGVSLEIQRPDGKSLMQIGKIKLAANGSREVTPSCMVPGHMSTPGELPIDSVQRLLHSKLLPLVDHLDLQPPQPKIEKEMSREFGIFTEYVQQRFVSELLEGRELFEPFMSGDATVDMEGCLDVSHESLPGSPPCAYILPGNRAGVNYCFAWLSHDELAQLKMRGDIVEWWLEQIEMRMDHVRSQNRLEGGSSKGLAAVQKEGASQSVSVAGNPDHVDEAVET